jgi:Domain of unknown function (DU1801)
MRPYPVKGASGARAPAMSADVAAIFAAYPAAVRAKLKAVRRLIFDIAKTTDGVAPLQETLKWGEPAYLPATPKIGSTIRLGWKRSAPDHCAVFFHCQTTLIGTFRTLFADEFAFEGNRALLLRLSAPLPKQQLAACVAMALTYHRDKLKRDRR